MMTDTLFGHDASIASSMGQGLKDEQTQKLKDLLQQKIIDATTDPDPDSKNRKIAAERRLRKRQTTGSGATVLSDKL